MCVIDSLEVCGIIDSLEVCGDFNLWEEECVINSFEVYVNNDLWGECVIDSCEVYLDIKLHGKSATHSPFVYWVIKSLLVIIKKQVW